jgi:hypothetical protein
MLVVCGFERDEIASIQKVRSWSRGVQVPVMGRGGIRQATVDGIASQAEDGVLAGNEPKHDGAVFLMHLDGVYALQHVSGDGHPMLGYLDFHGCSVSLLIGYHIENA